MISSETPYKLAEIIRDTWPQLYNLKTHHESLNSSYLIKKQYKDNDNLE